MSTVPAAAASSSSDATPTPTGSTLAGGKLCSACQRTLHGSAFSATQAKAPAKSRKCMECVVHGKASVETEQTAAATKDSNAATSTGTNGKTEPAATATTAPKKKGKPNTPGAIARERAAARQAASSSSSSSAPTNSKTGRVSLADSLAAKAGKKGGASSIFNSNRKSADQRGKKVLLDEDEEWFLPEAEAALAEVFRRFAPSCPPDTPREKLGWTLADIQKFAVATNGKEFGTEELMEIQDNLEHDDKGRLTCQGFLDFYHLQTTSHPDETFKDLRKLGYNDKLELTKKE